MISFQGKHIYLACGRTDMRKNINGLTSVVKNSFALDPFESAIYVFCNGARNRLKILEWDGNGFWLKLRYRNFSQNSDFLCIPIFWLKPLYNIDLIKDKSELKIAFIVFSSIIESKCQQA